MYLSIYAALKAGLSKYHADFVQTFAGEKKFRPPDGFAYLYLLNVLSRTGACTLASLLRMHARTHSH